MGIVVPVTGSDANTMLNPLPPQLLNLQWQSRITMGPNSIDRQKAFQSSSIKLEFISLCTSLCTIQPSFHVHPGPVQLGMPFTYLFFFLLFYTYFPPHHHPTTQSISWQLPSGLRCTWTSPSPTCPSCRTRCTRRPVVCFRRTSATLPCWSWWPFPSSRSCRIWAKLH